MAKKVVFFRADGDSQIGWGHIMRCVALGQMLKIDFEIKFAIQSPTNSIVQILNRDGFEILILPKISDFDKDFQNFSAFLTGTEIVVLDGYNFKDSYQKNIKKACRKLVYIDDLASWHQVADVVINHAGLIQRSDYQAETYTQFLLGTAYALIRPPFLNKEYINIVPNNFTKYLVNFGGADPLNITFMVCDFLLRRNNNRRLKITAIIGDNYLYLSDLKKLEILGLEIFQNLSAENMVKQIENHQIVICSPSTIAYEVASIGKSMLLIQTAENQGHIARFFEEKGLSLYVEKIGFNQFTFFSLSFLTLKNKRQKIENQRSNFDGKSGERLKDFFLKL